MFDSAGGGDCSGELDGGFGVLRCLLWFAGGEAYLGELDLVEDA